MQDRDTIDELRRRVYSSDATDADRAAYRAAIALPPDEVTRPPELPAAPPGVEAPPPLRASRRVRLPGAITGAAGALVVLAAVVVTVVPRAVAGPAPAAPTPIPVDVATRAELVRNLTDSGPAGIAAYLLTHHPPPALQGAKRIFTIERWGSGPRDLRILPTDPATAHGRATVLLVTQRPAHVGWTALGAPPPDAAKGLISRVSRASDQQAGVPTVATFRYGIDDRPVRLHVEVPKGVRWGAAVVFSD